MLSDVRSGRGWRDRSAREGRGESFASRVLFVMRPTFAAIATIFDRHHANEAKHGENTCQKPIGVILLMPSLLKALSWLERGSKRNYGTAQSVQRSFLQYTVEVYTQAKTTVEALDGKAAV